MTNTERQACEIYAILFQRMKAEAWAWYAMVGRGIYRLATDGMLTHKIKNRTR